MTDLFMHGWGLGEFFFTPLQSYSKLKCDIGNRGYFNSPFLPNDPPKRLYVHSFGLHLIPEGWFSQVDELILLASFLEFHSPAVPSSPKAVQRMIRKCQKDSQGLLFDFYQNCFFPEKQNFEIPQKLDEDLLLSDLTLLNEHQVHPDLLKSIPKILILQGEKDQIVPLERAQNLRANLPHASIVTHAEWGHSFPYSHPQETWEEIQKWRGE